MASAIPYTIIGTPYSTYTRAITLGLTYKGIPFDQVRVVPHSDVAYDHHPFGFLPTLVVREPGKDTKDCVKLRESQAIARYVDRVKPEPSLTLGAVSDGVADRTDDVDAGDRLWEFVSLAGAHGFAAVEKGVVKPHIAAVDAGLPASKIAAASAPGLPTLQRFLAHIEAHMVPAPLDAYVLGPRVTWADFFLFPLLSDLRAVERDLPVEGNVFSARLRAWITRMDALEAVQKTREGTLEASARPP